MANENWTILDRLQAGIEATPGTAVPATRKVYAEGAYSYDRALAGVRDKSGTFDARRRVAYARESVAMTFTDSGSFEDIEFWLAMGVKGGAVRTPDVGSPIAYAADYTPAQATHDLKSATFEVNHVGNVYRIPQVMLNTMTLRGDSDANDEPQWMVEAEGPGLGLEPATFTPAIPDRATELIDAKGTKLFIDDGGGTIGTTQKLGALISWSVSLTNNIEYKAYAENKRGMAPGKFGRGERTIDCQLTLEFEDDLEFAKYRSDVPVERIIRLESEGSIIHGAVRKRLRLDIYGYWSSFSQGERAQSKTMTMNLAGYHNVAAGTTFSVSVVNALATAP